MPIHQDIWNSKKAVIFELDNVLYPEKDYLLQVYYLFANLLEYATQYPAAADLITFFKKAYEHNGKEHIFQRAAGVFGIEHRYETAFHKLHTDARLPLKLLLFPAMQELLNQLFQTGKSVFLLTKGNPLMQLNKLKQVEWQGLDQQIKVYFYDELITKGIDNPLAFLLQENSLTTGEVLFIAEPHENPYRPLMPDLDYMPVSRILHGGF